MKALSIYHRHLPSRCAAFTLIEVLVSTTLLSIIVVMLAGLLNASLRVWGTIQSDSERHRSGRALTDFIGRELRQAMLPVEGLATTTTKADLQCLVDPANITSNDAYHNGDSIFWQAPLATENTYGDIAEVGYFVQWINNGATSTPTLCRFFANPSATTGSPATVQPNPNYLIYTNQVWLTPALLANVAPADNLVGTDGTKHGYAGLFAENVIGLWVRSFGLGNSEPAKGHSVFDSRAGYAVRMSTGASLVTRQYYLPAMIKVSIAQVDSKFASRLTAAKSTIRPLVNSVEDASAFYTSVQNTVQTTPSSSPSLSALYPGLRIYSTDVYLDNAK